MGTCSPSSTRNHFSHHPFTCTEGTERTKSELGEHCLSSTPQERTRVRFPSSVDRISVNRPPPLGGNDAKRPLQGCLRDSLPPVVAVDEEALLKPEHVEKYRQHCRNLEVAIFPDSGHMVWQPDYDRFISRVNKFLDYIDDPA